MNQINKNQDPIFVPVHPGQIFSDSTTNPYQGQPNVIVVKETNQSSGRCSIVMSKKRLWGYFSPNEEYCCIIVVCLYIDISTLNFD